MQTVTLTQQEIWSATRHQVVRSKKSYTRKQKHKLKDN
jgi:hypothetical protein